MLKENLDIYQCTKYEINSFIGEGNMNFQKTFNVNVDPDVANTDG